MWDTLKIMFEDIIEIKMVIPNVLDQEIELRKEYEENEIFF